MRLRDFKINPDIRSSSSSSDSSSDSNSDSNISSNSNSNSPHEIRQVFCCLLCHLPKDLGDICLSYTFSAIVPVAEWSLDDYWWNPWGANVQVVRVSAGSGVKNIKDIKDVVVGSICGQIGTFTTQGQLIRKWEDCKDVTCFAASPSGTIVLHREGNSIETRDLDGALVTCWQVVGQGGRVNRICCGSQGEIVLVYNGLTTIHDPQTGKLLSRFDSLPTNGSIPPGVALLPHGKGNYIVAEPNKHCVEVFDSKGHFIRQWGRCGSGPGEFYGPRDVVVMPETGIVVVADSLNNRIQAFTQEGKYLDEWGFHVDFPGKVKQVQDIAVLKNSDSNNRDEIVILDSRWHRVQVYTPEGQLLRQWGKEGSGPGEFNTPSRIAVSCPSLRKESQVIAVCDLSCRIQLFRAADGAFLCEWKLSEIVFDGHIGLCWLSSQELAVVNGSSVRMYDRKGKLKREWRHVMYPSEVILLSSGHVAVLQDKAGCISFLENATGRVIGQSLFSLLNIRHPIKIVALQNGQYVVTEMNGLIHFFSPFEELRNWKVDGTMKMDDTIFSLAQLSDGRLAVANRSTKSINIMSLEEGKVLCEFGRWGSRFGELIEPEKLAVWSKHQVAVSAFRSDDEHVPESERRYTQPRVFIVDLSRLKPY